MADLGSDYIDGVQAGLRPVLIVSSNLGNATSYSVIVVPMTTQEKKAISVNVSWFDKADNINNTLLCSQIRCLNTRQLQSYMYTLTNDTLQRVEDAIYIALDLPRTFKNSIVSRENNTENDIKPCDK